MPWTRAITAAIFAAGLVIAGIDPAGANPNDIGVGKYKRAMTNYVSKWAEGAKKRGSDKNKATQINMEFSLNVKSYNFPENMGEDDGKEIVPRMPTGLDTAAKAAFGRDVSATMTERHNLKKGAPRLHDVSVRVN